MIIVKELFAFEQDVLHCIKNNPKNDNFEFYIRARNNDERIEVLNCVKGNKDFFEEELVKVIGKCNVLIDFDNLMITVKKIEAIHNSIK